MKKKPNSYDSYDVFLYGEYVATAHVKYGAGILAAKKRACQLKERLTPFMNKLEVKYIGTF